MITEKEFLELIAFCLPLCIKAKCANKNMNIELASELYALHPEYTLEQHKQEALSVLNKMMKANTQVHIHPEDKFQRKKKEKEKERERKATDPEYKAKRNKSKSISAQKQKLLNATSYLKKLFTKRALYALLKRIRLSPNAIPCMLLKKGICLRMSEKKSHGHGNVCPLKGKYCLEDGKCHPLK